MSYGRFDAMTLDGFVSGSVTNNLQARLAVKTVNSGEGWQKSVTRDDELGEQDKLSLRLSLAAQLGDDTDAAFSLAYWEDNSDSLAPQFVKATYPSRIGPAADIINQYAPDDPLGNDAQKAYWAEGAGQQINMESTSLSLQITHAINDSLTFKSLPGYAAFDDTDSFYERSGIQGIPASVVPDGFKSGDITGRNTGLLVSDAYIQNTAIEAWTQEFRLSGETETAS
jgi:iron complex outermembrane recepter protein